MKLTINGKTVNTVDCVINYEREDDGSVINVSLELDDANQNLCSVCKVGRIDNDFGCTNIKCKCYPFK